MARGILDSLMSATYFNASALRLLRQLVTSFSHYCQKCQTKPKFLDDTSEELSGGWVLAQIRNTAL